MAATKSQYATISSARPANGTEPGAIEQVFAIYANVIELDDEGRVLNAKFAEKRATDYLRRYLDPKFEVIPPYEDWEIELHEPPPIVDPS